MKRIRITMLKTHDYLLAGRQYNQTVEIARDLIARGLALGPQEVKPVGPSEIKPIEPTEFKAKKKQKRPRTVSES